MAREITPSPKYPKIASGVLFLLDAQLTSCGDSNILREEGRQTNLGRAGPCTTAGIKLVFCEIFLNAVVTNPTRDLRTRYYITVRKSLKDKLNSVSGVRILTA